MMKYPGCRLGRLSVIVFVLTLIAAVQLMPVPGEAAALPRTVVVGIDRDLWTTDPQGHNVILTFGILRHIYDPLVERNVKGEIRPRLAESWERLDDTRSQFKLRKGVRFHNGEPFTAESVKVTLERVVNPAIKSGQAYLWGAVKSVEVKDDWTVVIETKAPVGALLAQLTTLEMLPPKATRALGDKPILQPIGTGAFQFVSWRKNDKLVLKANPHYWEGKVLIDELHFRPIPSASTRVAALETGEVHAIYNVPPISVARLERNPDIEMSRVLGPRIFYVGLRGDRKPFDDPRVRRALNYAIDREAIAKNLWLGTAIPAVAPLSPVVFGSNDNLAQRTYDLDRAKKLLAEAGYPNGLDMNLTLGTYQALFVLDKETAEAIAGQLARIGAKVTISIEESLFNPFARSDKLDMYYSGWGTLTLDADFGLYQHFYSRQSWVRYKNDTVDNLLDRARATIDPEARRKNYAEAQKLIWEDAPWIFLTHTQELNAARKVLSGFTARADAFMIVRDAVVQKK